MPLNVTEFSQVTHQIFSNFDIIDYLKSIKILLLFVFGISLYSIFIFKFYRFVGRRDVIKFKFQEYNKSFSGLISRFMHWILYVFDNVILIPIFVFFWFIVLAALLALLSKNTLPSQLLLTSVAIIAAIRVTAYYDEDLSRDLAKMIPFALLGVFLIDISFFSLNNSWLTIVSLFSLWDQLIYYLIFVIVLEIILRLLFSLIDLMTRSDSS